MAATRDCSDRPVALKGPANDLEFAMPVFLILLLLNITLVYHAAKTGRLQPWAFIILMIPGIGALAYIAVELVPEWLSGPGARQARMRVAKRLDPEKLYRELSDRLDATDTIANRAALAAECLRIERFGEAERHYDHILRLPMGEDPAYALGKAKAEYASNRPAEVIATLDELQKRWPDFHSAEGHLLYARACRSRTHRGGAGGIPRGGGLFPGCRSQGALRVAAEIGGTHR